MDVQKSIVKDIQSLEPGFEFIGDTTTVLMSDPGKMSNEQIQLLIDEYMLRMIKRIKSPKSV